MEYLPRVKFRRVKKQTVKLSSGWILKREDIKGKSTVAITLYTPNGLLRLRVVMTRDEWKEFKK